MSSSVTPWGASRRSVLSATALVLALGTAGCVDLPSSSVRLHVITWWQEKAEQDAFSSVIEHHQDTHPGVQIELRSEGTGQESRDELVHRMLVRAPLATFQANAGADLLRWAAVDYRLGDELRQEIRIDDLSGFFAAERLNGDVVHQRLIEDVSFRGGVYGLPINIHRLNVLYYNVAWYEEFVREHPDFTTDLAALCPEDSAAPGPDLPPIAIGARSPFVLTLLAFENVLPALATSEFYEALWRGEAPRSSTGGPWTDDVRRALRCVKRLSRFFVDDYEDIDWARATDYVANQTAAFTVMGDWVDGRHVQALRDGVIASRPFPGTEDMFVYTSDTFPIPSHGGHRRQAREFLATLAKPDVQARFSEAKGSIPARRDIALTGRALEKKTAFEDTSKVQVLATSGFFPHYFPALDLEAELNQMIRDSSPAAEERVVAFLENVYPLLERWRERLEGAGEAP